MFWRNNLHSGTSLPNDDTPGVGNDDYTLWRTHFGQTGGSGAGVSSSAAVPEPCELALVLIASALPAGADAVGTTALQMGRD